MNTEPTTPALQALLRAAAAPASEAELRGEAAALAAFRAARRPVHDPRSTSLTNRIARALTIKAAIVAVAVTGTGGVAFAASTGALPVPSDTPIVGSEAKQEKKAKHEKAEKVRNYGGLCNAALQGNAGNSNGKVATSTAFAGLIAAAGGAASVPSFCAGILGTPLPAPVPPADSAPATAEVPTDDAPTLDDKGKSANSGKDNAPGQLKEDGSPAQGKGKATAPGQTRRDDDAAEPAESEDENGHSSDSGRDHAPGQLEDDDQAEQGKGHAKADRPTKHDESENDESENDESEDHESEDHHSDSDGSDHDDSDDADSPASDA